MFGIGQWPFLNAFSFLNWRLLGPLDRCQAGWASIVVLFVVGLVGVQWRLIGAIFEETSLIWKSWYFCDLQGGSRQISNLSSTAGGSLMCSWTFGWSWDQLPSSDLCGLWDHLLHLKFFWLADLSPPPSNSWSSLISRMPKDSSTSWIGLASSSSSKISRLQHPGLSGTFPSHVCF